MDQGTSSPTARACSVAPEALKSAARACSGTPEALKSGTWACSGAPEALKSCAPACLGATLCPSSLLRSHRLSGAFKSAARACCGATEAFKKAFEDTVQRAVLCDTALAFTLLCFTLLRAWICTGSH